MNIISFIRTAENHEQAKDKVVPVTSNNEKTIVVSKPMENIVESPNVIQGEDGNPDNEFMSGEERPNKKENDNDADEGNERVNSDDDLKEPINSGT